MYVTLEHGHACVYQESRMCLCGWVGVRACVRACVCVCVLCFFLLLFNLHFKALLKALVYMVLWFDYNVIPVDVVNVTFYLVIISEATIEFLPGDNKDLLNGIVSGVCNC